MHLQDDKYQNLLAQLHELNRQNLLNENEKNEEFTQKIEQLKILIEDKKSTTKDKFIYKILYILIGFTLINILLSLFILFNLDFSEPKKEDIKLSEPTEQIIETPKKVEEEISQEEPKIEESEKIIEEDEKPENTISFEQELVKENKDETFEEMKPIIKKDTIYSCEDDNYTKIYKIPYTVEIKGKLYSDRFVFILQNDSGTRKCMINKNDM